PATPGPVAAACQLVRQSAYCAGWHVPHDSGRSDASSAEKRAGAGPCGASGARQCRRTNSSTLPVVPPAAVATKARARLVATRRTARADMRLTLTGTAGNLDHLA